MSHEKIECQLCKANVHVMQKHLADHHPNISLDDYKAQFPGHPILSAYAEQTLAQRLKDMQGQQAAAKSGVPTEAAAEAPEAAETLTANYTGIAAFTMVKKALHEVFGLTDPKAMSKTSGKPIPITTFSSVGAPDYIPKVDDDYVYDIEDLKDVLLGLEMNIPVYIYGHKGTGKTELWEQVSARTGRPVTRVQHTINTEEAHINGQWVVVNGQTEYQLGPLPEAMLNGWLYIADEYDFALPAVTSVYQAVLEGKPLVIKDAPPALRIIKPHPNFRFGATGNTNGSGDETGLYGGTNMQNSANYDRFGVMIHKQYMPKDQEAKIIEKRTGLRSGDAAKMVEFGKMVRDSFDQGKISDTVSVRTLVYACRLGIAHGSFKRGVQLSFTNKLSSIDKKVVEGMADRVFA